MAHHYFGGFGFCRRYQLFLLSLNMIGFERKHIIMVGIIAFIVAVSLMLFN
ncbi:MAG: hypothetical protein IJ830_03185 [Alphaproteobacteria bacterium]|nr:hypothetical protein [Alphaproteobacteria bacterium]